MARVGTEIGSLAALVAAPAVVTAPALAHPQPKTVEHCVVETTSFDDIVLGTRREPVCYPTVADLLRSVGLAGVDEDAVSPTEAGRRLLGAGYLAYHYADAGGSGGSLAVTGSCDGSGIADLGGWNDVISSTRHQACGRIKHFADANAQGDHQITQAGPGGLVNMNASLNDRVSSIYYYAS